jgi:hypothetical protein
LISLYLFTIASEAHTTFSLRNMPFTFTSHRDETKKYLQEQLGKNRIQFCIPYSGIWLSLLFPSGRDAYPEEWLGSFGLDVQGRKMSMFMQISARCFAHHFLLTVMIGNGDELFPTISDEEVVSMLVELCKSADWPEEIVWSGETTTVTQIFKILNDFSGKQQ